MPDTATISTSVVQAVVNVTEDDQVQIVEVSVQGAPVTIETGVIGPQGPQGPQGETGASALSDLTDVNVVNKVDKSVLVFDEITNQFIANDANTITTITDGGNF
jgi:hypothetical protein